MRPDEVRGGQGLGLPPDRPAAAQLSERAIARNEILVRARVIGGLQMVDGGEADDKIIAVLENDSMWKTARNLGDVPPVPVERLQHYFLAYKLVPGEPVHATIGKVCPGAFRALNQLATRMSVMQVQGTTLVAFRRSGPGGSPAAS